MDVTMVLEILGWLGGVLRLMEAINDALQDYLRGGKDGKGNNAPPSLPPG